MKLPGESLYFARCPSPKPLPSYLSSLPVASCRPSGLKVMLVIASVFPCRSKRAKCCTTMDEVDGDQGVKRE